MSNGWTEEQVSEYLRKFKGSDRPAVSIADVEPDSKHGPSPKDESKKANPQFRIHVHSKRRRLADPDGVSVKAAIDGLVRGGLFADDSVKEIQGVTFSQEKSEIEETILEIWEVRKP